MTVAHFTEKIKVNGRDSSDLNPPPLPTSLAGRRSFLDSLHSPGGQPQRPHFLWKWLSLSWQQGCHPRVSEAEATQTHVTGSENTGSDVSLESGSIYSHPCRTGLCRQQSHTRWPAIQPNSPGRPYANCDIAAPEPGGRESRSSQHTPPPGSSPGRKRTGQFGSPVPLPVSKRHSKCALKRHCSRAFETNHSRSPSNARSCLQYHT